ncbi:hypothetical protein CUMW_189300, partial [Citrus unshiu]
RYLGQYPCPFQNLKKIEVRECRQLKKLPLNSSSAKERRVVIEGSKKWWEELQWEDQATQNAFSSGILGRAPTMEGTFKPVPQPRLEVPARTGRHRFSQQRRLPCDSNWGANPVKPLKGTPLPGFSSVFVLVFVLVLASCYQIKCSLLLSSNESAGPQLFVTAITLEVDANVRRSRLICLNVTFILVDKIVIVTKNKL